MSYVLAWIGTFIGMTAYHFVFRHFGGDGGLSTVEWAAGSYFSMAALLIHYIISGWNSPIEGNPLK